MVFKLEIYRQIYILNSSQFYLEIIDFLITNTLPAAFKAFLLKTASFTLGGGSSQPSAKKPIVNFMSIDNTYILEYSSFMLFT